MGISRSVRAATRSTLTRATACFFFILAASAVHGACGFDTQATGPAGNPTDGANREAGDDDESGASQAACTSERTVCGSVCTDTKIDPANCGACGAACADGEACSDGTCAALCVQGTQRCGAACIDLRSDPLNCGSCGHACGESLFCSAGVCAPDCVGLTKCSVSSGDGGVAVHAGDYCADTMTDRRNCGACRTVCKANETCAAGNCAAVCATTARVGDVFAPNMVGCVAKIPFPKRASACPTGATTCTAQEWITRHGVKAPIYNYWTDDDLGWLGIEDGKCAASPDGHSCGGTSMRVCGAKTDPVGNFCNLTNCGYQTDAPNEYFGGCWSNPLAGTLCCTP